MLAGQPIIILRQNVERNYGKEAQRSNITAAKAIAGAVTDYAWSAGHGQDARRIDR